MPLENHILIPDHWHRNGWYPQTLSTISSLYDHRVFWFALKNVSNVGWGTERKRVRRTPGERCNICLELDTAFTPEAIIWWTTSYASWNPLSFSKGKMNGMDYTNNTMESVALPYLQQLKNLRLCQLSEYTKFNVLKMTVMTLFKASLKKSRHSILTSHLLMI